MFPDVTAEIFHVTPAAKLNDSPAVLMFKLDIGYFFFKQNIKLKILIKNRKIVNQFGGGGG